MPNLRERTVDQELDQRLDGRVENASENLLWRRYEIPDDILERHEHGHTASVAAADRAVRVPAAETVSTNAGEAIR